MSNCTLKSTLTPAEAVLDPLTELLRSGARDLIKQAVEAEYNAPRKLDQWLSETFSPTIVHKEKQDDTTKTYQSVQSQGLAGGPARRHHRGSDCGKI